MSLIKHATVTTPEIVARTFLKHRERFPNTPLVATSGGFDPLHVGHLRCIINSAMLKGDNGLLVIIVNGDGFLTRKKGHVFMPEEERLELISGLKGVDYVVPWDDGSQTVTGCLETIRPNIFTKGGDRSTAEMVPEYDRCNEIGCTIVFGIGGLEKIQSSSDLVNKYLNAKK